MDIQSLTHTLWPNGNGPHAPQVYALLDGARSNAIAPAIWLSRLPSTCLYAGNLSRPLERAAPYLVQLAPESSFFKMLAEDGWARAWGIFAVAQPDVTLKVLRKHFRSLLRVHDEQGRALAFRYYDPRVLRAYLPTCLPAEAHRLCGPVDRIVLEPAAGDGPALVYEPPGTQQPLPGSGAVGNATIRIRRQQVDAFRLDSIARFKLRLIEHAQTHFPVQCRQAGPAAVLATVELGVALAKKGGWHARRDVALYLNLMWMLGSFFETDPRHRQLFDVAPGAASDRLNRAMQRAMDHLDVVHGAVNQRLVRTLLRLRKLQVTALPSRPDLAPWLVVIAPGCHELDPDTSALAVQQADALMARRQLEGEATLAVIAVCTLLLGEAFERDPQFPWARDALAVGGAGVVQALLSGVHAYAQALLMGKGA